MLLDLNLRADNFSMDNEIKELKINKPLSEGEFIVSRKYKLTGDGKIKEASGKERLIGTKNCGASIMAKSVRPSGGRIRLTNKGSVFIFTPEEDLYVFCGFIDVKYLQIVSTVESSANIVVV